MQCILEDIWAHEGYSQKGLSWKSAESCILAQNTLNWRQELAFRLQDFMLVFWQVQYQFN